MNELTETTLRLFVALLLGGIIGLEREYRSKEAGFRTHFLVAVGSALFCIVSQYGFRFDLKDSSRVAAQVVSGIVLLGLEGISACPPSAPLPSSSPLPLHPRKAYEPLSTKSSTTAWNSIPMN